MIIHALHQCLRVKNKKHTPSYLSPVLLTLVDVDFYFEDCGSHYSFFFKLTCKIQISGKGYYVVEIFMETLFFEFVFVNKVN